MDPREKREDETWAEYGARIASMGIAPTESYFAGPTVNQFRPTGSDYTPQQLSTPIHQLQQQNIPQNVVPLMPTDVAQAGMATVDPTGGLAATDPSLQGTTPFSQASTKSYPQNTNRLYGISIPLSQPNPYSPEPIEINLPNIVGPAVAGTVGGIGAVLTTPRIDDVTSAITGVTAPTEVTPLYSETTDSGEVVPMSNENLSFFGAAPVPTSPSMNVDYSQALADIGVEPTSAGMAEVSTAGSDFFGGGVDAPFDFVDTSPTQAQLDDITRHSGLTFGIPVYTGQWSDIATHIPSQPIREIIRDRHDTISDFLGDETTTDKLQDLVNNQIAIDMLSQSGPVDFDSPAAHALDKAFKDNPNVVVNKDSLNAMVELAKKDYYKDEVQVQEAINEIKSGVDTFKDVTTPAGPTPAEIAAANAAANSLAAANARAKTAANNRAKKAAAAAQRKADLAAQKAAARRTALARQALKDSQAAAAQAAAASAAQAKSAQKAARAVLSRLGQDRNRPSDREIAAAIEVMSQVDSFGSGGQRGFMGAEVGIEDGGGYTGGDFSSGEGWE